MNYSQKFDENLKDPTRFARALVGVPYRSKASREHSEGKSSSTLK